jgi:hypothetical protein
VSRSKGKVFPSWSYSSGLGDGYVYGCSMQGLCRRNFLRVITQTCDRDKGFASVYGKRRGNEEGIGGEGRTKKSVVVVVVEVVVVARVS